MSSKRNQFCGRTRREMLWELGGGFGGVALASLLGNEFFDANKVRAEGGKIANPLAPKPPAFPAKAKSVIFLFMYGGPSQVDTFDYKPKLYPLDEKTIQIKTTMPATTTNWRARDPDGVSIFSARTFIATMRARFSAYCGGDSR